MVPTNYRIFAAAALVTILCIIGCSNNSNPLGPFQPEIINTTNNFQFQATAVQNVTATIDYPWLNTGTRAKVNQSCAITGGSAIVVLLDSAKAEVYRRNLVANGDSTSAIGISGIWTVRVILNNLSGTLNIRAQMQ